jgi:hypothetical protein
MSDRVASWASSVMSYDIHIGDEVNWTWGNGTGTGKVTERFTEKVTRTIDGSAITRNATEDEPAYLVEQADGGRVLKSASELTVS